MSPCRRAVLTPFRSDERGRMRALENYNVLYTEREAAFDAITQLVQATVGTEVSTIALIDEHHQWFKSATGVDIRGTERGLAFCDYTIRKPEILAVPDMRQDTRFNANALVAGAPFVRSYIGCPLRTPEGYQLGTICAIGLQPRDFTETDRTILSHLSTVIIDMLEKRRRLEELRPISQMVDRARWQAMLQEDILSDRPLPAVAAIRVDDFDEISDLYGSRMADRLISAIMDHVTSHIQSGTRVARLSKSVFGIAMHDKDTENAEWVMDMLREKIGDMVVDLAPGDVGCSTVSIGLVRPGLSEKIDTVWDRLKHALHRASTQGPDILISEIDQGSPLDWAVRRA